MAAPRQADPSACAGVPVTGVGAECVGESQDGIVIGDIKRAVQPGPFPKANRALPQRRTFCVSAITIAVCIAQQHEFCLADSPADPGLGKQETFDPAADRAHDPVAAAVFGGRAGQRNPAHRHWAGCRACAGESSPSAKRATSSPSAGIGD